MARGNAQILHNGKARGLNALERLIFRYVRRRRDLIAEVSSQSGPAVAISLAATVRVKPHHPGIQSVVLTADGERTAALARAVEGRIGAGSGLGVATLGHGSDARQEEGRVARSPDLVVCTPERLIDHIRRGSVDLSKVVAVTVDVPEEERLEQFSADLHFIFTKFERHPVTVAVTDDLGREFDLLEDLLRRPTTIPDGSWDAPDTRLKTPSHEESTMSDLPFDPQRMKEQIERIVQNIHHDEDPIELNKYRAYVRKYTNVFNRGYILAYLLKQAIEGKESRPSRGGRKQGKQGKQGKQEREIAPENDGKQSIFVSIGRSKRVRSRDLIAFFTSADAINQDDIGQVKVLDNYSFIEVSADKAKQAIDELNGKELRGRKLTVNYARRK